MWKLLILLKPFLGSDDLIRVGRCGENPGD
jgi:hypothetical protein